MLQGGKITQVSVHSHFHTCTAYIFGRKRSAHCAQLPFCTSGPTAGVLSGKGAASAESAGGNH